MCCPNCRGISSTARPHRFVGSRDEVAYIKRETHRLEELIRSLHKKRAALLHRLNALDSPISSLPVETMSTIFEFACQPHDFNNIPQLFTRQPRFLPKSDDVAVTREYDHFQLALGAVSAHWRSIAQATPRLWSSIALDISPASAEHRAAFINLCLENSRWTPIYLMLDYNNFSQSAPGLIHECVDRILIDSLPRCRKLHLIKPPSAWFAHFSSLSQLVDCSIDDDNLPGTELVLPQTAPLRRFSIQVPGRRDQTFIQIPWSGLTSLVVSQIYFQQAVQMLLNCPNLIEFRCCRIQRTHVPPSSPVDLVGPVMLRQLEILELSTAGNCDWARALVQHLHVPSLRQLIWDVSHSAPGDISSFFDRLPSTLSTVDLYRSSPLRYLRLDSHVKRLTVRYCEVRDLEVFLENLGTKVSHGRDRRRSIAFPKLMEFSLEGYIIQHFPQGGASMGDSLDPDIINRLFPEAMENRQSSGVGFRFDMSGISAYWNPATVERLRRLVVGGFDLKIVGDSGEVPWL